MAELQGMGLLMDGEVAIQPEGSEQPFIYRGFQMVDEAKFRDLRGDELRKMNQNGTLALVMAHLFSLALVRDIFARHVAQGSGPEGFNPPAAARASATMARPRPTAAPTASPPRRDLERGGPKRPPLALAPWRTPFQSGSAARAPSPGRACRVRRHRTLSVRFLPAPWPLRHRRGGLFSFGGRPFGGVVERREQRRRARCASASNSIATRSNPGPGVRESRWQ